jgi:hypothetical protein
LPKFPFLSPAWLAEARRIGERYRGRTGGITQPIKMNQVITEVPFGDGPIDAHMDTTGPEVEFELGHIEGADLKVTVDYETAKTIFVEGDPQAGIQAFMAGRIKIEGDVAKLMTMLATMQQESPDPVSREIQRDLKAITE